MTKPKTRHSPRLIDSLLWPNQRGSLLLQQLRESSTVSIRRCTASSGHIALLLEEMSSTRSLLCVMDAIPPQVKEKEIDLNDVIDLFHNHTIDEMKADRYIYTKTRMLVLLHRYPIIGMPFMTLKEGVLHFVVMDQCGNTDVYEWKAYSTDPNDKEMYQWTSVASFCCLQNENLKWTQPVVHCTNSQNSLCFFNVKDCIEPSIFFRSLQLRYTQKKRDSTDRNEWKKTNKEVIVTHPYVIKANDVLHLLGSPIGVWVVTKETIIFRNEQQKETFLIAIPDDNRSTLQNTLFIHLCSFSNILYVLQNNGNICNYFISHRDHGIKFQLQCCIEQWNSIGMDLSAFCVNRTAGYLLTAHFLYVISMENGKTLHTISITQPQSHKGNAGFYMMGNVGIGYWRDNCVYVVRTSLLRSKQKSSTKIPCNVNISETNRKEEIPRGLETAKVSETYLNPWKVIDALKYLENVVIDTEEDFSQAKRCIEFLLKSLSNPILIYGALQAMEHGKSKRFLQNYITERMRKQIGYLSRHLTGLSSSQSCRIHHQGQTVSSSSLREERNEEKEYMTGRRTVLNLQLLPPFQEWLKLSQQYYEEYCCDESPSAEPIAKMSGVYKQTHMSFLSSKSVLRLVAECFSHSSVSIATLHQLEGLLFDGIDIGSLTDEEIMQPIRNLGFSPSHLLLHEERTVQDYFNSFNGLNLSSSSGGAYTKHYYFELLCRLYYAYYPSILPRFILFLSRFDSQDSSTSPMFNSKQCTRKRSFSDRCLCCIPAIHYGTVKANPQVLWMYVRLLCLSRRYEETISLLLSIGMYCSAVEVYKCLIRTSSDVSSTLHYYISDIKESVKTVLYSILFKYCAQQNRVEDLKALMGLKPPRLSPLILLRLLRQGQGQGEKEDIKTKDKKPSTLEEFRELLLMIIECEIK